MNQAVTPGSFPNTEGEHGDATEEEEEGNERANSRHWNPLPFDVEQ